MDHVKETMATIMETGTKEGLTVHNTPHVLTDIVTTDQSRNHKMERNIDNIRIPTDVNGHEIQTMYHVITHQEGQLTLMKDIIMTMKEDIRCFDNHYNNHSHKRV